MISQRRRGLENLIVVLQVGALTILYWAWFFIWQLNYPAAGSPLAEPYVGYWALMAFGLALSWFTRRRSILRQTLYEKTLIKHLQPSLRQTAYTSGTLLLFLVIAKDGYISRRFLFTLIPVIYGMLVWLNYWLPGVLAKRLFAGARLERTLLIGPVHKAQKLSEWLNRKAQFGFVTVGVIADHPPTPHEPSPFPYLGNVKAIEQVMSEHRITQVVLLEFPSFEDFRALVVPVQRFGARLLIASDLEERLGHQIRAFDDDGLKFFALHEEPLENPLNRIIKRLVDLAVALPVVFGLLPFIAVVVWLLQRRESPGPLVFRQARAGIQNREFSIWKFRTMHVGNPDTARQASKGDSRVFPAGRLFRKFSIDEIPQFINVLHGEMSVVGPRPHMIAHNHDFAKVMQNYHLRSFVKPGITGLAQVRGFRGEAQTSKDIEMRLQSDMVYLENWSLMLDIGIIFRTAVQMFIPPNTAF